MHHDQIRCPCSKCCNKQYLTRNEVHFHLKKNGFERGYTVWLAHGESYRSTASTAQGKTVNEESSRRDGGIGMRYMVFDAAGPNFDWNYNEDEHFGSNYQEPNHDAHRLYKLLNDADEPLWNGCTRHSTVSAVSQLLNIKSEFNLPQSCYDRLMSTIKSMIQEDEKLPKNLYEAKKMVSRLGLGYEKIDVCVNNCILYYKMNSHKKKCTFVDMMITSLETQILEKISPTKCCVTYL